MSFIAAAGPFDDLGEGILQKFLRITKITREAALLAFYYSTAATFTQFVSRSC